MKLATYSFVIHKDDKTIPFEEMSEEEQEEYKRKFTLDFTDSIMWARGYQRVKTTPSS